MSNSIVIPSMARLIAESKNSVIAGKEDDATLAFLGFVLRDEEFGVDLHMVKQIVIPPPVTWVPRVQPHILGVISIRGNVVTLVDARRLMGFEESDRPNSARVLLVDVRDERIGLLVDKITQVRRVPVQAFEESPDLDSGSMTDHVVGIIRPDKHTQVTIIDLKEILLEAIR